MTLIIKFGGSSQENISCIKLVTDILLNKHSDNKIICVLSAFGKTTNNLKYIYDLALNDDISYIDQYSELIEYFSNIMNKLNITNINDINCLFNNLLNIYNIIYEKKKTHPKYIDYILSFGERISAKIIYKYLLILTANTDKIITYIESEKLINTDSNYQNANVNLDIAYNLIQNEFSNKIFNIAIVPGFIGTNNQNYITTIGRGGGDYTAAIYGAALRVNNIIINSDVDGIMAANPSIIDNPKLIKYITYECAFEMAYYGAKVLYHKVFRPVFNIKIPIIIKNTFNYDKSGTYIIDNNDNQMDNIIGITNIDNLTLYRFEGIILKGNIGITSLLFSAIADSDSNIFYIEQSPTESCINFCIDNHNESTVQQMIYNKFKDEFDKKYINLLKFVNKSVIAIIMKNNKDATKKSSHNLISYINDNIDYELLSTCNNIISIVVNSKNIKNIITQLYQKFII